MATEHVVVQGEYLAQIARQYGVASYKILWDHPDNASLREMRKNPNVLYPGDVVVVPDPTPSDVTLPTGQRHSFVLVREKLMLRLVLHDVAGAARANLSCELRVDGQSFPTTTDGEGKIEQEIPAGAQNATLTIPAEDEAHEPVTLQLRIGHLDPIDTPSGQAARLANLGYYNAPLDPIEDQALLLAVEEFQCEHPPLGVDGKCGPATQNKLLEVHGC